MHKKKRSFSNTVDSPFNCESKIYFIFGIRIFLNSFEENKQDEFKQKEEKDYKDALASFFKIEKRFFLRNSFKLLSSLFFFLKFVLNFLKF